MREEERSKGEGKAKTHKTMIFKLWVVIYWQS